MGETASNIVMSVLAAALALLGLALAARAHDEGMAVFGYGLVIFGVLFIFSRIGDHYDRKEGAHKGEADHG